MWIQSRGRGFRTLLQGLALLAMLGPAGAVTANPLDTFGYTSRAIGMGGGFTAAAEQHEAAYYNLAGIAGLERVTAGAGLLVTGSWFEISGEEQPERWLTLVQLGLAAPLPLGERLSRRLFLGLAVSLPTEGLYHVDLPDDRAPVFPLLGERNRRLSLVGGLAARLFDWWYVGLGVSLLPDVSASVLVDLKGAGGTNTAQIDVDYNVTAVAGMKFRPAEAWSVGLAYRGGHNTRIDLFPVRVDVAANLDPVQARVTAPAYAVPHALALGCEFVPSPDWTLALDLTWAYYGDWRVAAPEVSLCAACPRECSGDDCPEHCRSGACAPVFRDRSPAQRFHDSFMPRAGAEWRPLDGLALRAGYGYISSPVPSQRGFTNLLDGHRHAAAVGLGYTLADLPDGAPASIALDAHVQMQVMPETGWDKDVADTDGDGVPDLYVEPRPDQPQVWPTVSGRAVLLSFGVELRVEF